MSRGDGVVFSGDLHEGERVRVLASLDRLQWPGEVAAARVGRLAGGASNHNYLLESPSGTWVLRVAAPDAARFAIDRSRGITAHRIVAEAGIAPMLVAVQLPSGDCLTPFIPGTVVDETAVREEATLRSCVRLLRRAHAIPRAGLGELGPFRASADIAQYARTARREGLRLPPDIDEFLAASLMVDPGDMPFGPRLTHNDVQLANFLIDGHRRAWLLDWEYAGAGNVYFDLAMLASNADMAPDECEGLLAEYFGPDVRPVDRVRLRAMVFLSALREAMWSVVAGVVMTDTGWDYDAWAERFFAKVRAELTELGPQGLAAHARHEPDDERVARLLYAVD